MNQVLICVASLCFAFGICVILVFGDKDWLDWAVAWLMFGIGTLLVGLSQIGEADARLNAAFQAFIIVLLITFGSDHILSKRRRRA